MLERLVILAIVAGGILILGRLWQRWRTYRLGGIDASDLTTSVPTVLYFSAAWCGQCRLQQRPVIERLLATMRDCIDVREVDVERETDLARRFDVVTLPTTVVLAPSGQVVARNTGVVDHNRLDRQIRAAL